jgi:hypothetical protein
LRISTSAEGHFEVMLKLLSKTVFKVDLMRKVSICGRAFKLDRKASHPRKGFLELMQE